jgi:hypothetical protein
VGAATHQERASSRPLERQARRRGSPLARRGGRLAEGPLEPQPSPGNGRVPARAAARTCRLVNAASRRLFRMWYSWASSGIESFAWTCCGLRFAWPSGFGVQPLAPEGCGWGRRSTGAALPWRLHHRPEAARRRRRRVAMHPPPPARQAPPARLRPAGDASPAALTALAQTVGPLGSASGAAGGAAARCSAGLAALGALPVVAIVRAAWKDFVELWL